MLKRALPALLVILFALPLRAEPPARLDALMGALRLPEVLDVMAKEGLAYGDQLEEEMFAGRGGARWKAAVAEIYDPAPMEGIMAEVMGKELAGTDLDPLIAFFGSERGARIVDLEISARLALLDPATEEASHERVDEMRASGDPRLGLLAKFIEANDLIEMNVAGGLNANLAFYKGLDEGGAFPYDVTEEQMLRDVWNQEPDLRDETETWLYSYLALAYEPLGDDDLRAYIDISRTPEGKALNRALFAGFDVLFRDVSHRLGLTAAQFIAGQEL